MTRNKEFMSDEVWAAILHRYIVPYQNMNSFCPPTFIGHKDSEPLLDKKLTSRLMDLSAVCPGMNIDIYSNGVLLPKWKERGHDFIEFLASLPNRCRYLMSFHPYNHDGTENDYTETVKYLREVLRNRPPNVEFITVSHKSTAVSDAIQESWRSEFEGLPITVHSNASLNPWTGRIDEPGTVEFHGCPYGDFGHTFFGVTGNIIACCMDLEEEIVFGNVMTDEPQAMVDRLAAFYAEQQRIACDKTRLVHEVCRDCMGMGKRTDLQQLGVKV